MPSSSSSSTTEREFNVVSISSPEHPRQSGRKVQNSASYPTQAEITKVIFAARKAGLEITFVAVSYGMVQVSSSAPPPPAADEFERWENKL